MVGEIAGECDLNVIDFELILVTHKLVKSISGA